MSPSDPPPPFTRDTHLSTLHETTVPDPPPWLPLLPERLQVYTLVFVLGSEDGHDKVSFSS